MSVLIKGMELPENCWDCPCSHKEFGFCEADKASRGLPYNDPFPAWCPLVPVPPHGRLIDADVFERRCMFDPEIEDMQDVIYALRDYPTIIPAEEGEG